MSDIIVPEDGTTKATAGIDQTQLDREAEISAEIQSQRKGSDAHMQLQINRATETGDVGSLSPEQQTQLFNPEGEHSAQVVQDRVVNYTVEHNMQSMPVGRERPTVRGVGHDARTNTQRMPGPGEKVDAQGSIIMVNPAFADEQAEKMRNVSEADAKNTMARSAALTQLCATLSLRPTDVIGAIYCNFEQSRQYIQIYQEQSAEGIRDADTDFLPLRQYVNKFKEMPDGRVLPRPILPNEVGVFQKGRAAGKILCLNDKDLANTTPQFQVPRAKPRSSRVASAGVQSSPGGAQTAGFTVVSQVPVTVAPTPVIVTSVATPTPQQQPATPQQQQHPGVVRMQPMVKVQGRGIPQPSQVSPAVPTPRGNPKLPPPPSGFK